MKSHIDIRFRSDRMSVLLKVPVVEKERILYHKVSETFLKSMKKTVRNKQ